MLYRIVLLLKFVGVALYAGGAIASFVSTDPTERKRAVHRIASPGLLLVWAAGYTLTLLLALPLTEAWTLGGLVLSLASQLALVRSVATGSRSLRAQLAVFVPLLSVLALMVFRPTW